MNPAMYRAKVETAERAREHMVSCQRCLAGGGEECPTRLMCETGKSLYVARHNAEEAFERHARLARERKAI